MPKRTATIEPTLRKLIIEFHLKKCSYSEIAKTFDKSKSTIQSVIKRWKESGSTEARLQSGRPITVTKCDENRLSRILKTNKRATTQEIFRLYNTDAPRKLSRRTLYRTMRRLGLVRQAALRSLQIDSKDLVARKKWAGSRKNWSPDVWERFVFSDKVFVVVGRDKKLHFWRLTDEIYASHMVCPTHDRKFSVMVWGAITFSGERTMKWVKGHMKSKNYVNVLQENLLPLVERCFPNMEYTFMRNSTPSHTCRQTRDWLDLNNIRSNFLPPRSADLSVFENVWREIKVKLMEIESEITSPEHLYSEVEKYFYEFSTQRIKNLYRSIPRRIERCLRMKGHITKF